MQLSEEFQEFHLDCHIREDGNKLQIGLGNYKQNNIQSEYFDGVAYMVERIQSWAPDDRSSHPLFNKKFLEIIKVLFRY